MAFITSPIGIAFLLLFIKYCYQWISVSNFLTSSPEKIEGETIEIKGVSVIIPFRNESNRIQDLLNSIIKSTIDNDQIEILFIDDHSTDNTDLLIKNKLKTTDIPWKILYLDERHQGKKNAILLGIQNSKFQTIHTIDADCNFGQKFLLDTQNYFYRSDKNLIVLPVHFFGGKNLVSAYQIIENTALVALGLFQLHNKKPTMANGANLMFNKYLFLELQPFKTNAHISGGDDIFTLEAFFKYNSSKVGYSTNHHLAVSTPVLSEISELTNQRLRWIQKTNKQQFQFTANSQNSLAFFLVSFWVIFAYTAYSGHEVYFFIAIFCKITIDLWIQPKILSKFNSTVNPGFIIFSSILQILYIPALGLFSMVKKPIWKNRKAH